MSDGLCPACGCEMEISERTWPVLGEYEENIIEIIYACPCCEYQESTFDAE